MFVQGLVFVNDGFEVFHVGENVFQFASCVFGPQFVAGFILVFVVLFVLFFGVARVVIAFAEVVLAFEGAFIVELILKALGVFIGPIEQVIDSHEYFS